MKNLLRSAALCLCVFCLSLCALAQSSTRPRVLVLTDIEADPDDAQSMVRFLAYANEFDIEGLIATTSTHQRIRVVPESLHQLVDAYGQVQPNLARHADGFPTAKALKGMIKQGLPRYGMEGVGEGQDSEGSDWIIRVLEKLDARPVYVAVWGGVNCLAQALWKIQHTKSKAQARTLYQKLRVYTISDQDDAGPWIRKTFPDVFYIVSPGSYRHATWVGITGFIPEAQQEVNSNAWLEEHIQQGHGPLGAAYPDVAYGMEGDTPSFLGLIPNGLNDPEHPNYGGWGGRYELYTPAYEAPATAPQPGRTQGGAMVTGPEAGPETRPIWTNADDTYTPLRSSPWGRPVVADTITYTSPQVTLWRWLEDFQHDFAARMDWMVMDYAEANHPPVPRLTHPDVLQVKSGEIFSLNATGTTDPDGDGLSYYWFQYPEVGTYKGLVSLAPFSPNLANLHTVVAPEVTSKQTLHFILKVTDKGTPALTRYKRVIVEVSPR
ncbi:Protein of unknown function [Catalinimonas alkaloidigena]|uniref:DUF1593 domain-containing protein n=1 Tax=Catalinimonas alkaloidigena TaxID=1075417 RepID=A0A1G9G6T8_9BACT|nr:DUF1593 domain-containing protein [Catalinimonas alkaloidigena]SDK96297.1 Protein of unknown function [Catalinimonas alkaloidigena]